MVVNYTKVVGKVVGKTKPTDKNKLIVENQRYR